MSMLTYDVAVIGAGATGCALSIQLLRHLPARSRVVLLGAPGETARGIAYGTDLPGHLLNVRAGRMSAVHNDPSHFVRWLLRGRRSDRDEEEIAEAYVPRAVYGSYVHDTLQHEIGAAAVRVRIDVVDGTVTEVVERDGLYTARTASGIRYAADAVALCLGHGRPEFPLPAESVDPDARALMIADPWSDRRIREVGRDDRVLIVGTGLTMVDQLLALDAQGHRGPVTAVSRRGYVPAAHCPRRTEPVPAAIPADGGLALRRLARSVIAAARRASDEGEDWRAVVDGLRPVTQSLWQRLSAADRRRFCRHLESAWSVVRHRMAPQVAERVAAAREAGRLDVVAGRIVAVRRSRHGLTVGLQARGGRTVELAAFEWMINCSGPGRTPVNSAAAPLGPLVARGLLRPDHLGRGVDTTAEAEALGRTGKPSKGLYALGPLGAGSLLETTAMPDIREQCAKVARRIAASCTERVPAEETSARTAIGLGG